MTTDFIIACALAQDVERLANVGSSQVVDAINQLRLGSRREKKACQWLRNYWHSQAAGAARNSRPTPNTAAAHPARGHIKTRTVRRHT